MQLLLLGTSHRVATVDRRGRLADALGATGAWLARARKGPAGVSDLVVLATCHRVECYVVAIDATAAEDELRRYVREATATDLLAPGHSRYRLTGQAAVEHACRVACGLDSMIVGEAEIAGQIRRAVAAARRAGLAGVLLDRIMSGALRASGRARAETRIGVGAMSAATAAVSLLEHTMGSLEDRRVLVIGAGQAGRQALARLAKRRTGRLMIASRSEHHAREAAERSGAGIVAVDAVASAVAGADAVIAATVAPGYLLDVDAYRAATSADAARERWLIDLSVPRVLDPALGDVEGVTFRTADDLGDIVRASTARRLNEVPRVEAIVQDEARRTYAQFKARSARIRA